MPGVPGVGRDMVREGSLAVRVDGLTAQLEARPAAKELTVPRDLLEGMIDATRRMLIVYEGLRRADAEEGQDG